MVSIFFRPMSLRCGFLLLMNCCHRRHGCNFRRHRRSCSPMNGLLSMMSCGYSCCPTNFCHMSMSFLILSNRCRLFLCSGCLNLFLLCRMSFRLRCLMILPAF